MHLILNFCILPLQRLLILLMYLSFFFNEIILQGNIGKLWLIVAQFVVSNYEGPNQLVLVSKMVLLCIFAGKVYRI